jgi:hypothetical protein
VCESKNEIKVLLYEHFHVHNPRLFSYGGAFGSLQHGEDYTGACLDSA